MVMLFEEKRGRGGKYFVFSLLFFLGEDSLQQQICFIDSTFLVFSIKTRRHKVFHSRREGTSSFSWAKIGFLFLDFFISQIFKMDESLFPFE